MEIDPKDKASLENRNKMASRTSVTSRSTGKELRKNSFQSDFVQWIVEEATLQ